MRRGQEVRRGGLVMAMVVVFTACETEQKVVRLRPPQTTERATLPSPPNLTPTSEVARYPDGSYSVDGILREAAKLVGKKVRVKGYVHRVSICDPESDSGCGDPPHAYLVDDTNRPSHALLIVGSRHSRLKDLEPGRGEMVEGKIERISPDGRFVRARGMLVLPEPPPPPPTPPAIPAPTGGGPTPAEGTIAPAAP